MAVQRKGTKRKTANGAVQRRAPRKAGNKAASKRTTSRPSAPKRNGKPLRILVIDVGGTNVKLLCTGETEPGRNESGKEFTPAAMAMVRENEVTNPR